MFRLSIFLGLCCYHFNEKFCKNFSIYNNNKLVLMVCQMGILPIGRLNRNKKLINASKVYKITSAKIGDFPFKALAFFKHSPDFFANN